MLLKNSAIIAVLLIALLMFVFCCQSEKAEKPETEAIPITESLQARLDEQKAGFMEKIPEEIMKDFKNGMAELASSEVMNTVLKVGDKAPDFELPNAVGAIVKLSDLLKNGPVVLTWYRGSW